MKFLIILLFALTACRNVPVSVTRVEKAKESNYPFGQVEPHVVIHPTHSNIIAAGSVLKDFYWSVDGGDIYIPSVLKSPYGVYGDPVLLFDSIGNLYYFHLSSISSAQHLDRIVCQTKLRDEFSFNEGSYPAPSPGKVQDKHWVCYDHKRNNLYLTWTQFDQYGSANPQDSSVILFSKSSDLGESWINPIRISAQAGDCLDGDNTVEGAIPVICSSGKIIVIWSGPDGIVMQTSSDGGSSWLIKEKTIFKHVNGWDISIPGFNRANGFPILKINPKNNELSMVWCEQQEDQTHIKYTVSKDEGASWSIPITICSQNGIHQFFVNMAISPESGITHLLFYNQRKKNALTQVQVASKGLNSDEFITHKLLRRSFKPNPKLFFGDYLGLDARLGKVVALYPIRRFNRVYLESSVIIENDLLKN